MPAPRAFRYERLALAVGTLSGAWWFGPVLLAGAKWAWQSAWR